MKLDVAFPRLSPSRPEDLAAFENAATVAAPLSSAGGVAYALDDDSSGELPEPEPSRDDLLRRAAELGPRLTWASFVPLRDPVLGAKMQPQVVERRARLRKVVKATLAACVGCCVVALGVTALSGSDAPKATASATSMQSPTSANAEQVTPTAPVARTAPAPGVATIETLDATTRPKAAHARGGRGAARAGKRAPALPKHR